MDGDGQVNYEEFVKVQATGVYALSLHALAVGFTRCGIPEQPQGRVPLKHCCQMCADDDGEVSKEQVAQGLWGLLQGPASVGRAIEPADVQTSALGIGVYRTPWAAPVIQGVS